MSQLDGPRGLMEQMMGHFPALDPLFCSPLSPTDGPRTLAVALAYNGSAFKGWQVQPGLPTVQGLLEGVLERICGHRIRIVGAGRTDSGVHALGQVASFATTSALPAATIHRALNALVPPEIVIRAVVDTPVQFHARYSARAKTYYYYLWPNAGPGLFMRGLCWVLPGKVEFEPMEQALELLVGELDMKAFSTGPLKPGASSVRIVSEARIEQLPHGLWRVVITASGFLRHVVRNLVGSLVQVGRGKLPPQALVEMARARQRLVPGPKAPPGGLYLARVYYSEDPLRPSTAERTPS